MKEQDIKIILNRKQPKDTAMIGSFTKKEIAKVLDFHKSFPVYGPTPLRNLGHLSQTLGLDGFYLKDESYRFGLNAFKVLGGSYAIGKYLSNCLKTNLSDLSFEKIKSSKFKKELGQTTFVTATDGNHGRGVAWAATQFGQKSVVYMPKGSSEERLSSIRKEGAIADITNLNYDDAVRLAAEQAKKYGWVVIQDTAWSGYYDIPLWIMQGYATIAMEAYNQLNELQLNQPTHVFLQAGVGSFAGAIQAFMTNVYPDNPPKVIIVEPNAADCIFRSAEANDGNLRFVSGDMNTIMAGLACGEPNSIGWDILKSYSYAFISCPDWVSACGMRILGNPIDTDERVISGESGAVTTGIVSLLMTSPAFLKERKILGLDSGSRVLVISTEGATDTKKYRDIVWNGRYTSEY